MKNDRFTKVIIPRCVSNNFIISIQRTGFTDSVITGFVITYNDSFLCLEIIDEEYRKNGLCIVRISDIDHYAVAEDESCFKYVLQKKLSLKPSNTMLTLDNCDSTSSLLRSLQRFDGLIGIERELKDDVLCVGLVLSVKNKVFSFLEVDSDAEWVRPFQYKLDDITKISVSGGYMDALWAVAKGELDNYIRECSKMEKSIIIDISPKLVVFKRKT